MRHINTLDAVGDCWGSVWDLLRSKEPISRRANREDNCTGAFWEGRFKSIAILDEASLLATCAYIDLNPVAAGIAPTPEKSPHTSLKCRVDHCARQGTLGKLRESSPYVTRLNLERGNWLFPIEDKRDLNGHRRAGLLRGISLAGYLPLVDWTSQMVRPGKARVAPGVPPLLKRLQIDADSWQQTLGKMFRATRSIGTYFGSREKLTTLAQDKGRRYLKNLTGRSAPLTPTRPEDPRDLKTQAT